MSTILDVAVFLIFIVLLLQLSRPTPPSSEELSVWNDEAERRLLSRDRR